MHIDDEKHCNTSMISPALFLMQLICCTMYTTSMTGPPPSMNRKMTVFSSISSMFASMTIPSAFRALISAARRLYTPSVIQSFKVFVSPTRCALMTIGVTFLLTSSVQVSYSDLMLRLDVDDSLSNLTIDIY